MPFTPFKIWLMEPKTPQPHLKPFTTLESINSTLVVRADIVEMVRALMPTGLSILLNFLLAGLNHTLIVLIPKYVASSIAKVISKIIAC